MNSQVEELAKAIVTNGYRMTPARQAILETLVNCDGHVTADDLAILVRQTAHHVGRMTIYRTLDLLIELGLIRPIVQKPGAAHYVLLTDGNHYHFICNRCYKVIEFDDCAADEFARQLAQQLDFQVCGHLLEVHGLCRNCQN